MDYYIESLQLTVKTRETIAREYNVTSKTLIRRLKKKGILLSPGTLFPNTIKLIYHTLGYPAHLKENDLPGRKI